MREDTSVSESALQMTLFLLLQQVDPALYNHICVRSGFKESGFALSWVTGWFASDVGYLEVGSRLLDVFLVSHPLMPVYCVVALLVSQRRRLLSCKPSLKSVYANLRSLKLMATKTMSNNEKTYHQAMKQTEEIIASALKFIKEVPPQALIQSSYSSKAACNCSAIAMLSETASPSWCVKDTCPTEWGVLQRAKAMRTGEMLFDLQPSSQQESFQAYSNAYAAAGYKTSKMTALNRSPHFARRVLASLGFGAALLLYLSNPTARYLSKSRRGRLATPSHHQEVEILPTVQHENELKRFPTNTSDAVLNGPTLVATDDIDSMVVVIPPRYEIMASSVMNPGYELNDYERDFERFILKPLHAVIDKHTNALFAIVFNRPKGKALIVVPSRPINPDGWESNYSLLSDRVCYVAMDHTLAESIPLVTGLAKDSTAHDPNERVALVRYNQMSVSNTRGDRPGAKVTKDNVAIRARKVVKMGLQALVFAVRAVRTTLAQHVALFDESAVPPFTTY